MTEIKSFSLPGSRRVRNISPSATKEMAMLAAKIEGCVSLGQGIPSFATPPHIIDAVTKALVTNPACGKYSPQTGLTELRHRVARYLKEEKSITVDAESEICITVGGMEGLLTTILTIVDQNDEVLLPSPTYASYIEQIHLAGGKPKFIPLKADWQLDRNAMRQAVSPRTSAVILCNPGNPTGNVFSDSDIHFLCQLAVQHNFMVITDETYDYLVYNGSMPFSPLSDDRYNSNVVSIFSLSKKYALTGWRIGWVTAREKWMKQIMKVHDATTICAATPSQFAALAALNGNQDCVRVMRDALEKRRTLCCRRLDGLKHAFSYVQPEGAFYVMVKYLFSQKTSEEIAIQLLEQARVITIPGSSFGLGGEGHLRLSFGGEEDEINQAFDRIAAWLEEFYPLSADTDI